MAFNEGLKQKIDLLGALEARRRMEQIGANDDLQRRLMQEQLKAAEFQNMKAREVPTMTVPSSGLTGMPTKKFLHEMPGYISGVDPTEVFKEWNQNFRQGMASGGGRGGGGGGGGDDPANTHSDPYSNYTPNQLKELNAINDYQPQQKKTGKDSATIATELAKLYGRGGDGAGQGATIPSDPLELKRTLADEAANVGSMQSLINQGKAKGFGGKLGDMNPAEGMQPVTGAVNKEADKWNREVDTWLNTGSTVPPSTWPDHIRNAAANERTQRDAETKAKAGAATSRIKGREQESASLKNLQKQLYSQPEWKDPEIDDEVKREIKEVLPGFIRGAIARNEEPDIRELIDGILIKAGYKKK